MIWKDKHVGLDCISQVILMHMQKGTPAALKQGGFWVGEDVKHGVLQQMRIFLTRGHYFEDALKRPVLKFTETTGFKTASYRGSSFSDWASVHQWISDHCRSCFRCFWLQPGIPD